MSAWVPLGHELTPMQARQDKAAGLIDRFTIPGGQKYEKFIGDIGERCAESLLIRKFPGCSIVNANRVRNNQSGHDLVIMGSRKVLISIKASSDVEGFGWPQNRSEKSLRSDVTLHIDLGVLVTPRGRYSKYGIPVKSEPDVYVIPNTEVVRWVNSAKFRMGTRGWIYCWKRRPGPKDDIAQVRELLHWRNRFDVIADLIGGVPSTE
jgi:hypothetical protein